MKIIKVTKQFKITRDLENCKKLFAILQEEKSFPTKFEKDQEFIDSLLRDKGSEKDETFETQQTSQTSDELSKNTDYLETELTQPIWQIPPKKIITLDEFIANMKSKTDANEQGSFEGKPHHPENIHQVFFQIQMVLKILIQQMLHKRRGHFLEKNKGKDINLFFTI